MMSKKQPTPNREIKLSDMFEMKCQCGHTFFNRKFKLRKDSSIMGGDDQVYDIAVWCCDKCGVALQETDPFVNESKLHSVN